MFQGLHKGKIIEKEENSAKSEVNMTNFNENSKVILQTPKTKVASDNKAKDFCLILITLKDRTF